MDLSRLAFIDTETTGSSAYGDRIIDIAIICVDNGKVVKEFSSLINPQMTFSPFIETMTGITVDDVAKAPTFEDIASEIHELLQDRVFIAHNVQFDYSFVKSEFLRMGISFSAERLCTVKLSRKLYPEFTHHNLDSIIERFGFECESRHRAYPDAFVMWQFFSHSQKQFSPELLQTVCDELTKHVHIPPHLETEILQSLPEKPGVYIFYDQNGMCLYVGKSKNIKDRVFSHFANYEQSAREAEMNAQLHKVEFHETAGELGALLLESKLIKELKPVYNKRLREQNELVVFREDMNQDGYMTTKLEIIPLIELEDTTNVLAFAKTKAQAKKKLEAIAQEYGLCKKLLGIEKTSGSCFDHKLGKCLGACVGKEDISTYNLKFSEAFNKTRIPQWPFQGAIIIAEQDMQTSRGERFIFDNWRHYATIKWDTNGTDYLFSRNTGFDYDTYLILKNQLHSQKVQTISYAELEHLQQGEN